MNYLLRLYWLILTMNSLSIRADFDATNSTMEALLKGTNTLGFEIQNSGPWSSLLEDWAVGLSDHRQERIMRLPNTQGYYISNRVDSTTPSNSWSEEYSPRPPKIANRPQSSYNYQKPKPGPPNGQYNIEGQKPNGPPYNIEGPSNTHNSQSRKEVSETDLYLLGAIEKLVYRVDFMEKRLRKAEELIYYLMAGSNKNPEPCPRNFTRAGSNCYFFESVKELNWKSASAACKDKGSTLAEMETIQENQDIVTFIQAHIHLRGKDFWTGGLNPGLLWIWANSARPVANGEKNEFQLINNATNLQENPMNIKGNGRCLKLAYNPTIRTYAYFGHDCSKAQYYICEILDKSLSKEIQRLSKQLNIDV